jgi:hypothetical protein
MEKHKIVESPKEINGITVVQDIREAMECLKNSETIARFEWGNSMFPILNSGEYAIVTPVNKLKHGIGSVEKGDAVLCSVNGILMTHRVIDVVKTPYRGVWFKIGDTHATIYGWTQDVYGVAESTNIFERDLY